MNTGEQNSESVVGLVTRLWRHLDVRRRRQSIGVLSLMVLASLTEILSIGAVLPFLTALTKPSLIFDRPDIRPFAQSIGIHAPEGVILPLTLAFCAATVIAGAMRVLLLWVSTRLSFGLGSDLSNKVYRTTLYQPYSTHIGRNSSVVVDVIWVKVSEVIFFVILPTMALISAGIITTVICAAMAAVIPNAALIAFVALAAAYVTFVKLVKQRLRRNSARIAEDSARMVKTLQEGFGGIRDVLIDGSQETFADVYRQINHRLRNAQGENQIMSLTPRYVVESLGMLLIAGLAFLLAGSTSGIALAIPTLAAMALGMQRLLPAAQQLYSAWSSIHGTQSSLREMLLLLDQPAAPPRSLQAPPPMRFEGSIDIKSLGFRYTKDTAFVLTDVSLSIEKGSRVGFVGTTGSGKSTLLDLVMGLLEPTTGRIEIDGVPLTSDNTRAWQEGIAHVPQAVFLADCSIAENIAFGVPLEQIELERVEIAARHAQLAGVVESWPQGYRTRVGERGVQLSGGQRQRIGIARALYKRAQLIVFDEATSALDSTTESAVMDAINGLSPDITVLIIAHRLHTLDSCQRIVAIEQGRVVERLHLPALAAQEP